LNRLTDFIAIAFVRAMMILAAIVAWPVALACKLTDAIRRKTRG